MLCVWFEGVLYRQVFLRKRETSDEMAGGPLRLPNDMENLRREDGRRARGREVGGEKKNVFIIFIFQ